VTRQDAAAIRTSAIACTLLLAACTAVTNGDRHDPRHRGTGDDEHPRGAHDYVSHCDHDHHTCGCRGSKRANNEGTVATPNDDSHDGSRSTDGRRGRDWVGTNLANEVSDTHDVERKRSLPTDRGIPNTADVCPAGVVGTEMPNRVGAANCGPSGTL